MRFTLTAQRRKGSNKLRNQALSRSELVRRCIAAILAAVLIYQPTAIAADRTDIATSVLEYGGSVGKLLWVAVDTRSNVTSSEASQYTKLAYQVKGQIDLGRASSSVIQANFNVMGTALAYGAAVDPEPLSKAVAGIAAWGAKKTGDAVGQFVIQQSQNQAQAILAQGLKNSNLSEEQLKNMTPDDLRARVADLKIGGQTLRQILKDDPESLSMLQANATDIATSIGVEALAKANGTAADVKTIQKDLAKTNQEIADYQNAVTDHLDKIDSRISGLEDATRVASKKFDDLKQQVAGDSRAIQTLAQVSYSGWTTDQKLQAVESGLFPNLTATQQTALVESLKADKAREDLVAGVQQAAKDFGNLAAIAGNIGLPPDLVTGLQGAQIAATGIAQFAGGDILGGLSSLTSLVGLGAPDAAAQRYSAMMKYLDQQFAVVNQKLDKIIDLQVKTLQAVAALADEQQQFRREVLGQLDRIENTVLNSERVLQAILLSQWTECHALINGTALNGQFAIPTRDVLVGVVGNPNTPENAAHCYSRMVGFLDAWVKPAKWSGQIISASNFPADAIATDAPLQRAWFAFESQRISAYTSARDFLLQAVPEATTSPAIYLARLSQPVVDIYYANALDSTLAKPQIHERFNSFKCNQSDVLTPALKQLLCFGLVEGAASPPLGSRWQDLLGAALIGPQAIRLIDTGITLSTVVDFARRDDNGSFVFAKPEAIETISVNGATPELRLALEQHKGIDLLQKLRWLSEANVLQQSISDGDYTAELVEKTLYDPASRSINTDPRVMTPLKQQALSVMRANPTLARNVVVLAMRHAIIDLEGGTNRAETVKYDRLYYGLALQDFTGPQACDNSPFAREKLGTLFPKWEFAYFITNDQKQKDSTLNKCPAEFLPDPNSPGPQLPARGSGVAVSLADFYVLVPSPPVLSGGVFEQSDSLRLALAYRDRLSQAIIDRTMATTVKNLSGNGDASTALAGNVAFGLLNEGWNWQVRTKSK
jgi:hypothetical protein